jgi:hypothetical protein
VSETPDVGQTPAVEESSAKPRPGPGPALRPLTGLVGRGSELGRLIGHLDARRSVRLEASRGAGATALLRALCAEPPRPGAPDGTIALPVGLPVADLPAVAQRLMPQARSPVGQRRMLVLLDDRGLTTDDVVRMQESFPRSLLVVTGSPQTPDYGDTELVPVVVHGLSQHHAVGLVEAAMGRALSIEEGRAARLVATAVDGMPGPLVQAAAAVRDGGLSFDDVLDLLDDPPRPTALAVTMQHGLGDELHVTLSHLRALGDVPATTAVAAAACGLDPAEAARRLRRLAVLGLVLTDGRDGWTAASGIPTVSEPVRVAAAARVAQWLGESEVPLDVFDAASVMSVVADRVQADDRATTLALTQAALDRLPLDGLHHTRRLLEGATTWAMPEPTLEVGAPAAIATGSERAQLDTPTSTPDEDAVSRAADGQSGPLPDEADDDSGDDRGDGTAQRAEDGARQPAADDGSWQGMPATVLALLTDRRRLALVAVVAAAVIVAMLLVVPSLSDEPEALVIRGDVDLGVATLGESTSGTLTLDLSGASATTPVVLALAGPDADAFTVDPARCDTTDCRASITFTPDRSGTHLATVTALDSSNAEVAVADLSGSGTGDPPQVEVSTNLAVTLFPTEPTPIPAGGSALLPVGVRNNGPDDSTGARLLVSVPDRASADAEGCTFEETTLTCPLAELPAGTADRIEVRITAPPRAEQVRIDAVVSPVTDVDDAEGDNAAGFTYRVAAPSDAEDQS